MSISTASLAEPTPDEKQAVNLFKHQFKIARYDAGQFKELNKRLLAIAYSLGIKTVEPELMKETLLHLKTHFSDFSMEEISTAFSFYGAKKILPDLPHFNSFDIRYISAILIAWRDFRNQSIIKEKQFNHQKKLAEEQRIDINDPELQRKSYENLLRFVEQNKKLPIGWNYEMVFHHLEREKLITDTNEEKHIFLENVIAELNEEYKGDYKKVKEIITNKTRLVFECRKRRVQKYLEKYL